MALITCPLSHPKPHNFSPLCRSSFRPARPELVLPRTMSNACMFPKFGHYISKPSKLFLNSNFFIHFHNNTNKTVPATVGAALVEEVEPTEPQAANFKRILLSDVVVKRQRSLFTGRKWNFHDFSWSAVAVAFVLYVVTGLFGITLSFHRNLAHRSFNLPKWLEYFFAYCGVLALQRDPIDWVSTHRYHHQFVDSERDPHSPTEGFWFSHFNWLFDKTYVNEKCGGPNNVGDLEKQPFYRFLQRTYFFHSIALGVLLYALGGFPYLVWGMGVRTVWVYHITFLINSACHLWGKQPWNTRDLFRNNWWVALLSFGEGWHNNHHAFKSSARHGLEWWQLDMTWYVIRFLQAIGLAIDVKLPTEIQKQRMSLNNGSMAI